jgi:large-conductance mechanosensitive channel
VAFGFVDLDGNYQHVSSNFNKAKLPNLRQHEATKDSFDYTMTQEKMVLGRTYFIAASGHWGIPIRKSIFDHEGKRVGVMTAGLAIEGAFKIFTENLSLGEYIKVTLIRNRDQFVQYQSSNHETPKNLYEKPLADNFLMSILDTVMRKYHVSIDEIKQKPEIYAIETISTDDKSVQMALKYEPRYELWILSEIDHNQIVDDFIESFISYVLIFVIVHVILFLLFKIISHAEEKRSKDLIFQATHDELTKLLLEN